MKKVVDYTIKKINKNYLFLILLLLTIGIIRNSLELIGWYTRSDNYHGIYPTVISFTNTIIYVLLMVIAEGFIINKILKGNNEQLRQLIQRGAVLLLYLFIIIPILNNIFNYHFFKFPIYFYLHQALFPLYAPIGILVAFALVLIYFPIWLKKTYPISYPKRLGAVVIVYSTHFLIYYQVAMIFCFRFLQENNIFKTDLVNIYTNTYLIPVLIVYPFFAKKYQSNQREYQIIKMFYPLLWIIFIILFFLPGSWLPKN